jgi:hypothetical protein
LIKYPYKIIVIHTPENLGDKRPTLDKELDGEFKTHKDEFGLAVGILNPSSADIWSAIMENDVGFPIFELVPDEVATLRGCYIRCECDNAGYRLYGYQVNTLNEFVQTCNMRHTENTYRR